MAITNGKADLETSPALTAEGFPYGVTVSDPTNKYELPATLLDGFTTATFSFWWKGSGLNANLLVWNDVCFFRTGAAGDTSCSIRHSATIDPYDLTDCRTSATEWTNMIFVYTSEKFMVYSNEVLLVTKDREDPVVPWTSNKFTFLENIASGFSMACLRLWEGEVVVGSTEWQTAASKCAEGQTATKQSECAIDRASFLSNAVQRTSIAGTACVPFDTVTMDANLNVHVETSYAASFSSRYLGNQLRLGSKHDGSVDDRDAQHMCYTPSGDLEAVEHPPLCQFLGYYRQMNHNCKHGVHMDIWNVPYNRFKSDDPVADLQQCLDACDTEPSCDMVLLHRSSQYLVTCSLATNS